MGKKGKNGGDSRWPDDVAGGKDWLNDYEQDANGCWRPKKHLSPGVQSYFGGGSTTSSSYTRCYEKHPDLSIGGGTVVGRSCSSPKSGYNIYVGLDHAMHRQAHKNPWSDKAGLAVIEGCFPIPDHGVPGDVEEFKKMIKWMQEELALGMKIHIGCFGGHGRTGLVLAALVAKVNKTKDAIQWVRKHHCHKAVESKAQVEFLVKHFGVEIAEPSKPSFTVGGWPEETTGKGKKGKKGGKEAATNQLKLIGGPEKTQGGDTIYRHVKVKAAIW